MTMLFLCTGNSRAARWSKRSCGIYSGYHFTAYNAGLAPSTVNLYTVRAMEELGFDLEGHRAKSVKEDLDGANFA